MKWFKLGMPVFLMIVGLAFLISAINLPKANLGNPNGPLYFPVGISILLIVLSVIYLIQELRKAREANDHIRELFTGRTPVLILSTIVLGVVYALIFETLGFLVSTILFLGALLFVVNGPRKWVSNIIVTLAFSFMTWYAFGELLGVSLP
ncbi:Tripartite tricarboxylate transporter TctB family protein [Bhargavaea cecembensis DSE10]|uniref:Tripartite tricarboxylate transporter TctB family protein n=1 Tax=Bhargavaea cecembensis DSE10 TaxID=1235279 RepID=M7NI13_9BACL|nr:MULTISPECIES: tripartite tricarboxylate transporter TctB family protein [Bhargavaea]EMR06882.1 Tripartite tricarboxylate transporter TctB family protein [Bhargavaea cecembensis DSE10]